MRIAGRLAAGALLAGMIVAGGVTVPSAQAASAVTAPGGVSSRWAELADAATGAVLWSRSSATG